MNVFTDTDSTPSSCNAFQWFAILLLKKFDLMHTLDTSFVIQIYNLSCLVYFHHLKYILVEELCILKASILNA